MALRSGNNVPLRKRLLLNQFLPARTAGRVVERYQRRPVRRHRALCAGVSAGRKGEGREDEGSAPNIDFKAGGHQHVTYATRYPRRARPDDDIKRLFYRQARRIGRYYRVTVTVKVWLAVRSVTSVAVTVTSAVPTVRAERTT